MSGPLKPEPWLTQHHDFTNDQRSAGSQLVKSWMEEEPMSFAHGFTPSLRPRRPKSVQLSCCSEIRKSGRLST
jgi:hypothetical protein